jgi:hypothetical protein
LLALEQNAQSVAALRPNPPLFAAMVAREDTGTDSIESLGVALSEYVRVTTGEVGTVHTVPYRAGVGRPADAQIVYAERDVSDEQRGAAYRAFQPVASRLSGLTRDVPARVRERLGLDDRFGTLLNDWVWVLFHLASHFPHHFARGAVRRRRLFQLGDQTFTCDEEAVQLGGLPTETRDRYPGLVFSYFPRELDLVTASGYVIDLLRQAVSNRAAFRVTEAVRDQLVRLHQEFAAVGRLAVDVEVRVLRLDNSFRTSPAAQWAGYQPGGAIQHTLLLSHLRRVREVCVVRGPATEELIARADRAGSMLPVWPDLASAPLLDDASAWLQRVARRRELQTEQFYFAREDGSPDLESPIPPDQVAWQYWETTRPSPGWCRLVTDHRGNVERWLGFVLYTLKEGDPDSVEIGLHSGSDGEGRNAVLTLKNLNIFQASARAMELAGWVWRGAAATDEDAGTASNTRSRLTPRVCFDDPWVAHGYPPPAAGRYIRFHRGDRSPTGETEWRPGWAWAERPEDGWAECGECSSPRGRVPVARGRPPAVCDWLPNEWHAGFFPLGGGAEHLAGWRELVRSVLVTEHDTIPPDDREYGWLTLTRATRQLAHHLGMIPPERLLAPYPPSRADARREVEPLLDGLVLVRSKPNTPPEAQVRSETFEPDRPESAGPVTNLEREVEQLLAEARRGYAGVNHDAFTLVAIPAGSNQDGARVQRCERGSPDTGQIRDGVFYWPFGSIHHFGTVTVSGRGAFALVALDEPSSPAVAFRDFSGRAAATLLAAAPPWMSGCRPAAAPTTWAAAVMFVAPSALISTVEQPTGARILSNPWAASIAALRDILTPGTPPPPPRNRPEWDATARVLWFRDSECKRYRRTAPDQETLLAAFQEEGWPDAIDDPLTPGKLATTVESLNNRLQHIRFSLNGAGTGVCWRPV